MDLAALRHRLTEALVAGAPTEAIRGQIAALIEHDAAQAAEAAAARDAADAEAEASRAAAANAMAGAARSALANKIAALKPPPAPAGRAHQDARTP